MALALRPGYRALLQAFGTTIAFGMLLQPAIAEEQVQKIQVTGSSIKRIAAETALPVQTLSSSEIKKTGATNVAELIQNLPAMQGFSNAAANVGAGGVGYASASIHNLGGNRTLVLLNGKRMATFAGQTLIGGSAGVNLNSIPIAAIERVELLTDGASSIYGSDAIGGVINFILRSDFRGVDLSASYNSPEAGGAEEKRASITAGYGNLDEDRFNVMVSFSHTENDPLRATQRSNFALPDKKTGAFTFTGTDGNIYNLIPTSSRSIPSNATVRYIDPVTGKAKSKTYNPVVAAGGECGEWSVLVGANCRFIYPSELEIYPEQKQDAVTGSFQFKINDKTTFFADALYSAHEMTSRIAPPPGNVPIDITSSLYSTYLAPTLAAGGVPAGATVTSASAGWRLYDGGRRVSTGKTDAFHFSTGIKGEAFGIDYSAAFTHSQNKWSEELKDGYFYNDLLGDALAAGNVNPFVPKGNQTAAAMADLAAAKAKGVWKEGTAVLDAFELRGSKEIFQMPAGGALLGAGIDFKREADKYEPSELAQGTLFGGQFPDFATDIPFDVSRNNWGIFSELVLPVFKNFEATGSIRYDDYSDVGGTTNYKIGARWQAMQNLLFRGSFNTGFRAPRPAQTKNLTQLYGVTANPYDCPYTDSRAVYCDAPGTQYQVYTGGSDQLKPEESKQFTFGFRFEPASWVSLGADYWNVKVTNVFGTISETQIASDYEAAWNNGSIRSDLYKDPLTGQPMLAWYQPLINTGDRKVSGVDYDVTFGGRTAIGRFTSNFKGTWMISDKEQTEKGGEYFQTVGRYDQNLGRVTVRQAFVWANTLSTGDFDNRLTLNYKSGYIEDRDGEVTGDVFDQDGAAGNLVHAEYKVKEWVTLDWQTAWRTPVKGLSLTGGILNIGDAHPPFSLNAGSGQSVGYNPQVSDPRGRTYYLQAGYTFK